MPNLSQRVWLAWQLGRHMGLKWICQRATWAIQHRAHYWQLRTPSRAWDAYSATELFRSPDYATPEYWRAERPSPRFFFDRQNRTDPHVPWTAWDSAPAACADPATESRQLAEGTAWLFGYHKLDVGYLPDWHRNPWTSERMPEARHWSEIADFDSGDIKMVWEVNRFGWAYALTRAYWRTSQQSSPDAETYPQLFWNLLDDWRAHNPPYRGANWKCGQEISLRMMAWVFAYHALADSPSTTAERRLELVRMLAISTRRVAAHIGYALSQQNNHGISEAVGLWTVGHLFPELQSAEQWEQRGRAILEQLARTLIYDDGSFSQHSWNYHRVMLQLYTWAIQLAHRGGVPFSATAVDRVARAAELLYQMVDPSSGDVPVYGQNDGALVLPLSNCDRTDFRPAVQAAAYATRGAIWFPPGPWDEERYWLGGAMQVATDKQPPARTTVWSDSGKYVILRNGGMEVFSRCGGLLHRPSHADQLHVDLRWRGLPIAIDAGTYSYNAPQPWKNPLAATRYHNAVTVDGQDQMVRVSRFLWLPWIQGRAIPPAIQGDGQLVYWRGEHDGFERAPLHVRYQREIVLLGANCCVVFDGLRGTSRHTFRLHWLVRDMPYAWNEEESRLTVTTECGDFQLRLGGEDAIAAADVVRADPVSPRGWRSRYYCQREPALSVACIQEADQAIFCSVFAPAEFQVHFQPGTLHVAGRDGTGEIRWASRWSGAMVTEAFWKTSDGGETSLDMSECVKTVARNGTRG